MPNKFKKGDVCIVWRKTKIGENLVGSPIKDCAIGTIVEVKKYYNITNRIVHVKSGMFFSNEYHESELKKVGTVN